MRILFVSSNPGTGASEDLWTKSAQALAAAGHDVFAAAPWRQDDSSNKRVQFLQSCKIPIHDVSRSPLGMRLPRVTPQRFWQKNLEKAITGSKPQLIVLSNGTLTDSIPFVPTLAGCGIPFVTLDHGVLESNWPSDSQISQLLPIYQKAVTNFFVSEASRKLAERQLAIRFNHSEIVRNPFLVDYTSDLPWAESAVPTFACVGRLLPRTKGQDLLLRVFSQKKWRDREWALNFFGSGPNETSLRRECEELGLPQIAFAGHADNMTDVWRTHQALILPSRQENMPVTIVEAMLCARVCIASPVGGIPELLENGRTGYIADAATPEALDSSIEQAWQQQRNWQKIGADAQTAIRNLVPKHPAQDFARQLETLIENSHR